MSQGASQGALIVTGGGRGIGAEIARRAAANDQPVVLVYQTRAEAAAAVVRQIEAAGGRVRAFGADVGDEAAVERTFSAAVEAFGAVSGLVNAAVFAGPPARVVDTEMANVERAFRTNVLGALHCARALIRRASTRTGGRGGAIVTLTSAVAERTGGVGSWVPFSASKVALETLSRGLAKELASDGIRVNVVRCGVIGTETRFTQPKEYLERTLSQVPLGRMGEPSEVAAAALWLLSGPASYITGATLDVAGGL